MDSEEQPFRDMFSKHMEQLIGEHGDKKLATEITIAWLNSPTTHLSNVPREEQARVIGNFFQEIYRAIKTSHEQLDQEGEAEPSR